MPTKHQKNMLEQMKVAYIHGRPSGHPVHNAYAKSLNADFIYVDHKIRWHDDIHASKFRILLSWLVCAITFPNRKKYDLFFCEVVREPILFMRFLGLIGKKQKVISLMGNETFYFLKTKRFNRIADFLVNSFIKNCDAIICSGTYQAQIAKELFPQQKIFAVNNGLTNERFLTLKGISYNPKSNKILIISDTPSDTRAFYKGIDLAFKAYQLLKEKGYEIELHILGSFTEEVKLKYLPLIVQQFRSQIFFHGRTAMEPFFSNSILCIHTARGDAFPTSTIECAAAGLPVLVSVSTGTQELMTSVSDLFVVEENSEKIYERIKWFLDLPALEKEAYSENFRKESLKYTVENATKSFKEAIDAVMQS